MEHLGNKTLIDMRAVELTSLLIISAKKNYTVLEHLARFLGDKTRCLPKESRETLLRNCFELPGCTPKPPQEGASDDNVRVWQAYQACLQ